MFATEGLDDVASHAKAVEASPPTVLMGENVATSPDGHASNKSREDGQTITSAVEGTNHVTKRRSAPAVIQSGHSPANSVGSDATLLNPPRPAPPLTPITPFRLAVADDDHVFTKSSSRQDLSGPASGSFHDEEISRHQRLVEKLQADLATERENALHDRGVARQALDEAQDDIADLEAEVSDLKNELETEKQCCQSYLDEVSDLRDELETEKQNSQDDLDEYRRRDRGATAIITECHEHISELEAALNLERRKTQYMCGKAEEFMSLAQGWQDAFHRLCHDPAALWKMLIRELRERGFVFDYQGHLHRVGLRQAILDAEHVDQWAGDLGDGSLLTQEAGEGSNRENTMDAVTQAGDIVAGEQFDDNASGETDMGDSQVSAEEKTAGETQADATADEEHVVEQDGHFALDDDTDLINDRTRACKVSQPRRPGPQTGANFGEAVSHGLRRGVYQLSDAADSAVVDRQDFNSLDVEDESDVENVASKYDLPGVSHENVRDGVSQQDETDGADSDGPEMAWRMQPVKVCEVGAVSWSREGKTASWEAPSRVMNPHTSFLGFRHALPFPTTGNGFLRPLLWSRCSGHTVG